MKSTFSLTLVALCGGLVLGAFATSCGPQRPTCSRSTCTGCCDSATGQCVTLASTNQCGQGGEVCRACSLGQTCVFGSCQSNPGGQGGGAGVGGGLSVGGGGAGGGGVAGGSVAGGGSTGGGGGLRGDSCASPIALALDSEGRATAEGSLTGYTDDSTVCSGFGPDAVYLVTLSSPGTLQLTVTSNSPSLSPRVNVRSACSSSSTLACVSVADGAFAKGQTSELAAGAYFIWVDSSAAGSTGSFLLEVTFTASGSSGDAGVVYVSSSISAACDDLSVGATDILGGSSTQPLSDDSASLVQTLSTPFTFYGASVTSYGAQSNGMVQFFRPGTPNPLVSNSYANTAIPSVSAPPGFAAPLWDDLYPSSFAGATPRIRTRVFSTGGTRTVVEWLDLSTASSETASTRFQAKFFSTGVIEFHYCAFSTASPSGATVGVQDFTGMTGTQSTMVPTAGSGVRFTP